MLQPKWIFAAIVLLGVVALLRTQKYYGTIYHGWDAQFYYAMAHSLTFDQDTNITNDLMLTPYSSPFDRNGDGRFEQAPRRADGRIVSQYPVGMSVIEAPFLGLGYLARRAIQAMGVNVAEPVGYSTMEIWFVAIGLLLIFAWALTDLYRILAQDIGPVPAASGVFCCWWGTSLFYYSAIFPLMSHAMSFVLLVGIIRFTRDLKSPGTINRALMLLGLCLAGAFLVRPQQIIVVVFLLPLFVYLAWTKPIKTWGLGAAVAVALGLAAIAIELAMNEAQFGNMTVSGYAMNGQGFNWLHPHLTFVLLSGSRGLLLFSPIVLVAAVGYIFHRRSVPWYAWPMAAAMVAQVYVVAAWWSPQQGDSFGCRMLSDNSAVIAIGMAVLFANCARLPKRWVVGVATCLAVGCTMVLLDRYMGFGI